MSRQHAYANSHARPAPLDHYQLEKCLNARTLGPGLPLPLGILPTVEVACASRVITA
jgi:hypothetical protein